MCTRHHRVYRRLDREAKQRKREARRANGECIHCPGDRPAKATLGSTSCLGCRVRRNRIKPTDGGVQPGVYPGRDQQIAARTRTGADGRTRYHGQGKRGQQPRAQLIGQDIRYAREGIAAAEAGYALLDTDEVKQLPRIQRDDVGKAADHQLERVIGHLEDVLERRGHWQQRHGRRDGE